MRSDLFAASRRLSDSDLMVRIRALAAQERGATVLFVAHLAELDTRDAHFRAGHGSLFAYCRDSLALSEQDAYSRIAVARAARRFPVILEMLESGVLNLTTVRLLAPRLTADNHRSALDAARGKSKLQVEELAARLWPRPDVPSFVRKLPPPRCAPTTTTATAVGSMAPPPPRALPIAASQVQPDATTPSLGPPPSPFLPCMPVSLPMATAPPSAPAEPPPRRSAEVTPLSPDRYRIQVTIGGQTFEKLQRAKDLLRHAIPTGDEAAILDRALTALLASLAQRKFAAAEKPRPSEGVAAGSRHVPAEVKRTVWQRDLGRCAFVGTNDRRCGERAFLEFHHVRPFAAGGEATVTNIELRCRNHNGYEARAFFGPARSPLPRPASKLGQLGST